MKLTRSIKTFSQISILLIGISGAFIACDRDVDPAPLEGTEYMPLEIGNYWIYDVVKHEFFGDYTFSGDTLYPSENYSDTSTYQLKELIYQEHTDLQGDAYYELRRFIRPDSSFDWTLDSLWSCKIEGNRFIRDENNVSYIRLHFPINLGKEWDMNALNSIDTDSTDCEYSIYRQKLPYQYGDQSFDDVWEVVHCEDSTILNNYTEIEYYASGVGLVYRSYHKYDFCFSNIDSACIGQEVIDNGTKYTWNLVEYGNE